MKKAITISIPEPCHENWAEMSPTEKGKFCGVCTKEVIDFTASTDEDLVKILSGKTNVCGRFKKNQLDREVKLERKSGINFAPYAASLLLPLSLLGNSGSMNGNNDVQGKSYTSIGIGRYSNPDRALIQTTGKIYASDGTKISNVRIITSETGKTFFSDSEGHYEVQSLDQETLIFSKNGYDSQTLKTGSISAERDIFLNNPITKTVIMGKIAPPKEIIEVIQGDIIQEEEASEEKVSEAIIIKGTITDEDGIPLPGASVVIDGTTKGTQSDFDGNYSLEAEPGQILVISYVGYETQEITLSNISNSINVTMKYYDQVLGGMVIVGYTVSSYEDYSTPQLTPEEKAEEKRQRELAYKNEIEFKRIKQARKKAARELNKKKRK